MMNVYLWLLVAIVIAAVVLVVAGTIAADESDARERTAPADRSPWAVLTRLFSDARAGARSLLNRDGDSASSRDDLTGSSGSTTTVDEFFEATRTEQRAYVDADEIQEIIQQLRPGAQLRSGAQVRPGAQVRSGAERH
jgi:hypothetical protein